MFITYKYRIKDKRATARLRAISYGVNQVWNWCNSQHEDTISRFRSGAPNRRWLTAFDLMAQCKGVGAMLGVHQHTVQVVCKKFHQLRKRYIHLRFRSSFGQKRALGWIPFQAKTCQTSGNCVTYRGHKYRFFGSKRRPLPMEAKGGAFHEDSSGRWWICFDVEIEKIPQQEGLSVGIDLGLKEFATLSDGRAFPPLQSYRAIEAKLAVAQRAGNKRRVRALHARASNVRQDYHHKLSTSLARDYAFIAVGNVNAKQLAKTRMAKSVLDAGWSSFRNMLRYKATTYVEVDEKFTTQTCSSCGALPPDRPKGIAGLGIRSWDCSACGASHDRDVNAALNILKIGRSVTPHVDGSRRIML